jgi:hypothetical protein
MVQAGRPRTEPQDDDNIQSRLDLGLNYVDSPVALPAGSTPEAANVVTTDSGSVRTRGGTQEHESLSGDPNGYAGNVSAPFSTKGGNSLLVTKQGVDLVIYAVDEVDKEDVSLTKMVTKSDVWPEVASSSRFDHVVTSEATARIIMVNGVSVPVQLSVVESNIVVNGSTSSFDFESKLFEFADVDSVILWVNQELVVVDSVSYANETLTVTTSAVSGGTGNNAVNIVFFSWQWLCQSILLVGNQTYQSVTRFMGTGSTELDLSVAIPTELLQNLDPEVGATITSYYQSKTTSFNKFTTAPSTFDEYAFTSGMIKDADNASVAGFSHSTFGDFEGGVDYREIHMFRNIPLDFNGDADGVRADKLYVLFNGNEATQVTATNQSSYAGAPGEGYIVRDGDNVDSWLADPTDDLHTSVPSSTKTKYIGFDVGASLGYSGDSLIEIFYLETGAFHGDNAVEEFSLIPKDGAAKEAYGIQEHANYLLGSFPRTVSTYQGRLVFGGFPANPMRVITSEVAGTSITGAEFVNFSIKWGSLQSVDPVLVPISSNESNAYITAMGQSSGSLIVFTLSSCFRLYGGDSALTPSSVIVGRISNVGCINAQSLAAVQNALFFLSESGVFRVAPSLDIGDFDVRLISKNLGEVLKNPNNRSAAWMTYAKTDNRLYLGVSDSLRSRVANTLFTLSVTKAAWDKFTLCSGYWTSFSCASVELRSSYVFFWVPVNQGAGARLISYPYFYPLDFSKTVRHADLDTELPYFSYGVTVAPESVRSVYNTEPFLRSAPIPNMNDLTVRVDGEALVYGQQWYKLGSGQVVVSRQISDGAEIVVEPANDEGNYPTLTFADNVFKQHTASVVDGNLSLSLLDESIHDDSMIRYGLTFPVYYTTPVFVRGILSAKKFSSDFGVVLDNRPFWDAYTAEDVNIASGQDPDEIGLVWKRQVQLSVGLVSDLDSLGELAFEDAGKPNDMVWGLSAWGLDASPEQAKALSMFNVSPRGVRNLVQAVVYSYSGKVFDLKAIQFVLQVKGRSVL